MFRLEAQGLELMEVAPWIDPGKDILSQMEFPVAIPPTVATMDPGVFRQDYVGDSASSVLPVPSQSR